ncbi:MAG TPA: RNA methyltransferase [Chitinophagaceae bacterium]|jgi:TrmH family RNA methyltransferase|nr:RNA methyltransferase [Chitinophagaceae bacterium]
MLVKSKLKYIQSLGQKKPRDEAGVFIAEGPKLVKELLETAPDAIEEIFALKEWMDQNRELLTKNKVEEITEPELERISKLSTPNKVIAIIKKFDVGEKIVAKDKITLALDTIQDPGNLGTIIRTADWFGVEQIVCSHDCADVYNPKVVQATMGSIARVKVFYVDLEKWLSQQKDVRIYAAVLEGKDITTMKKINEGIILIGNESKGINDEILKLANVKITIPKKGKAESLNAAVAAGVLLGWLV